MIGGKSLPEFDMGTPTRIILEPRLGIFLYLSNVPIHMFWKRFRKQEPPISDSDLSEWALENLQPEITAPYTHRTTEQVCSWIVQRIKNSKNATVWVYNTKRLQEIRDNPPDNLPNIEKFMKQFEDDLYQTDQHRWQLRNPSHAQFVEHLDMIIYPRICAITSLMSICGKNKDPFIDYLAGQPARP